ncbi:MAG: TonB-dependent receptor family protein [Alistipes sp.]|nr:TonB-dependent receptor family protein [Alistipes sp.]
MKKIILAFAFVLCTGSLYAQKGTIRATLLDINNEDPVAGAVVALRNQKDSADIKYFTSVHQGAVTIPNVDYGDYTLTINFLGYRDENKTVKVNKPTVNLGKIYITEIALTIDAVGTQGQAMRTSQKGDTVVYNADAYKVAKDADTEALLSKMPGITILDGEVEAQGESVGKVFVDGKEFFGQDVSTAIKTLPAEMVSRVEVYNKLSDMAEFSGVDDGEGFKAINIVTRADKRTAQFGKIYGTWGISDKYLAGANINIFNGNHRVSLLGMANNTNQQNFAFEDILGAVSGGSSGMSSRAGGNMRFRGASGARNFMVRQQDGVSQLQSFGLNYTGTWAKKLEVEGSYFFNNSSNKYWSDADRTYLNQYQWADTISNTQRTKNNEHRFNAKFEYKINDNHQLMMRPSFSLQNYRNDNYTFTERYEPDNDDYEKYYDHTLTSISKNWGFNIGNTLVYRMKLGKDGRTLVTDLSGRYSKNDRESSSLNNTLYAAYPSSPEIVRDTTLSYSRSYTLTGSVMYTEPVTQHSQLTAQYRANYSYSDIDRQRYDLEDTRNNPLLTYYDPDYSNIYNSGYLTQRVGPGYNYRKDRTSITVNVEYQRSTLKNEQEYPAIDDLKHNFNNVVYFSRLEHSFNSQNTIRVFARSSTTNPSVTQLQNVFDISNTQNVTEGNPSLKPTYQHSVFANYNRSIVAKGSTFMVMGHINVDNNYIADDVTVSTGSNITLPDNTFLQAGSQYKTYRNMSGSWNSMIGMNYGFPMKAIRSNININLNASLRETPSLQDGQKNKLFGQYYNAGIVIGSNISERLDFTLTYNGGYNLAKNSITDNNESMVHYASIRFKWVTWADFTFSGNGSFTQNKGITQDYNDKVYLLNLALGKKIFRNRRGEVTIGVNDIFNQKTNFRRTVTTNYIENLKYNTLGRYYVVQFVYNLRSYGGRGSSDGVPDSLPSPGTRPMGPPPGGGPPRF